LRPARRWASDLAQALATELQARLPSAFSSAVSHAGSAAQSAAVRQGDQTAGAFSRSLRRRSSTAAFKLHAASLDVSITDTGVDAELARIRAKHRDACPTSASASTWMHSSREAEVERLEAELLRLGATHPNVQVRADTAAARAALAEFRAEIAKPSTPRATRR
jgi:hypothetical protein